MIPSYASIVRVEPSGRYIICSGTDEVWTIDIATGQRVGSAGVDGLLHTISVRPWGIAISEFTGRMRVLSMPGLEERRCFEQGLSPQAPWLDPQRPIVAFVGADGSLRVLDVESGLEMAPSGAPVFETKPPNQSVQIMLSPDGSRLIVADGSGFFVLAPGDPEGMHPLFKLSGNRVSLNHSPDWSRVTAVADGDPVLHVWDSRDWTSLSGFPGHERSVLSHAFSRDGSRIVTVDAAGTLRVWQSSESGWRRVVSPASLNVHQLGFDRATGMLALPGTLATVVTPQDEPDDGIGRLYESPRASSPASTRVAISEDGVYRAEADLNGQLVLSSRDDTKPESERVVRVGTDAGIVGLKYKGASSGFELGVCLDTNVLLVLDPRTGQILRRVGLAGDGMASDLDWSPDGARAAVAFRDGTVGIVEESGEVRRVRLGKNQIRSIAFLPNGSQLAAVGDAGRLYLLDIGTGLFRASDRLSEHSLFCVAIHPGGEIAMVGDRAGKLYAVDLDDLEELAAFDAGGSVMSIAFSPSGDEIGLAALGRPVELWGISELVKTYSSLRPGSH